MRGHPCQGRHPSPCQFARRSPHDTGTNRPRAPTSGTGVALPPSQRDRPWRLCRPKPASLRADPPPPGRGAGHESAPAPEGRLVATRAGGAGSVGSISGREKATATPTSACRAAESDRVDDALDLSPSATQSSTPQPQRRRFRGPSVPGDAPRYQRAAIPVRGVTRRRASSRAVVPTTRGRAGRVCRRPERASPLPLLNEADRGGSAAPSTHRCEPYHPLRGRALITSQRPPKRDGSLPRVPAVPDPSARSRVGGRRRRRRCQPVAPPNPIASTTPLIGRCQRLGRRCRRCAVIAVGFEVSDGSSLLSQRPLLCLALAPLSASSLSRVARY